ncbi:hypothetical protein NL676_016511 [Syzygium grande]|nr:hypothetical protein NL676_016511 [Syzygium grande]
MSRKYGVPLVIPSWKNPSPPSVSASASEARAEAESEARVSLVGGGVGVGMRRRTSLVSSASEARAEAEARASLVGAARRERYGVQSKYLEFALRSVSLTPTSKVRLLAPMPTPPHSDDFSILQFEPRSLEQQEQKEGQGPYQQVALRSLETKLPR